ncbi:hypothetical protein Salat_1563400 [Sesamum alatum]|uniref:Avr9/Cf-9 rapidly elicited protein 146 n=1 Tax=Sesamum alatum TaxID=300844 RepID=A0AAE1YCZ3_9LAMI|nr:hypothetical protein Salat_1563400 [Sesamum alatum]
MEQNLPIIAKKFWNIVRVVYYMLRKGISKGKLFADLSMMMKRGKIAGKAAIHNLILHHHAAVAARRSSHDVHLSFPDVALNEYEFSCSNSPAPFRSFHLPFHLNKRKQAQPPIDVELVAAALEMINSAAASPALPGFGRTPMVRQLRITDSPFPLRDVEENSHVDEAAEEFILKFYKDLKRQNAS